MQASLAQDKNRTNGQGIIVVEGAEEISEPIRYVLGELSYGNFFSADGEWMPEKQEVTAKEYARVGSTLYIATPPHLIENLDGLTIYSLSINQHSHMRLALPLPLPSLAMPSATPQKRSEAWNQVSTETASQQSAALSSAPSDSFTSPLARENITPSASSLLFSPQEDYSLPSQLSSETERLQGEKFQGEKFQGNQRQREQGQADSSFRRENSQNSSPWGTHPAQQRERLSQEEEALSAPSSAWETLSLKSSSEASTLPSSPAGSFTDSAPITDSSPYASASPSASSLLFSSPNERANVASSPLEIPYRQSSQSTALHEGAFPQTENIQREASPKDDSRTAKYASQPLESSTAQRSQSNQQQEIFNFGRGVSNTQEQPSQPDSHTGQTSSPFDFGQASFLSRDNAMPDPSLSSYAYLARYQEKLEEGYGLIVFVNVQEPREIPSFTIEASSNLSFLTERGWVAISQGITAEDYSYENGVLKIALSPLPFSELDPLERYRITLIGQRPLPLRIAEHLAIERMRKVQAVPVLVPDPEPVAVVEPEPEPTPTPKPAPEPVLKESQLTMPPTPQKKKKLMGFLATLSVLLLLLAGFLLWWFFLKEAPIHPQALPSEEKAVPRTGAFYEDKQSPKQEEQSLPAPTEQSFLGRAHAHLRGNADLDQSLQLAKSARRPEADRSESDGAFLLIEDAAQKGNTEAMYLLGQFYDPLSTLPRGSIQADPSQALHWYSKAKEAGLTDVDAAYTALLNDLKQKATQGVKTAQRLLQHYK